MTQKTKKMKKARSAKKPQRTFHSASRCQILYKQLGKLRADMEEHREDPRNPLLSGIFLPVTTEHLMNALYACYGELAAWTKDMPDEAPKQN